MIVDNEKKKIKFWIQPNLICTIFGVQQKNFLSLPLSFSCSPRKEKCQFSGDSIMEFIDNEMRESIRVLKKSKQCHLVPLEFDTNTFQILFTIPFFYRFYVRTVYWKRFGFFFAMDRYKPNIDVFNDICVPYFYIFSFKTVDIAKLTFFCNTRKSMMKTTFKSNKPLKYWFKWMKMFLFSWVSF